MHISTKKCILKELIHHQKLNIKEWDRFTLYKQKIRNEQREGSGLLTFVHNRASLCILQTKLNIF